MAKPLRPVHTDLPPLAHHMEQVIYMIQTVRPPINKDEFLKTFRQVFNYGEHETKDAFALLVELGKLTYTGLK